jgi:hypothetical protein
MSRDAHQTNILGIIVKQYFVSKTEFFQSPPAEGCNHVGGAARAALSNPRQSARIHELGLGTKGGPPFMTRDAR